MPIIDDNDWNPLFFSIKGNVSGLRIQDVEYDHTFNPKCIPHRIRPVFGIGRRDTEYPLLLNERGSIVLKQQNQIIIDSLFRLFGSIGHYAFEVLTNQILAADLGCFHSLTPRTGDGGIDGIIFPNEPSAPTYLIQCKQYSSPITVDEIEKFALQSEVWAEDNDEYVESIFVALSGYTSAALDAANICDMLTIDGHELADLARKNGVGIVQCSFPLIDERYWMEMADVR